MEVLGPVEQLRGDDSISRVLEEAPQAPVHRPLPLPSLGGRCFPARSMAVQPPNPQGEPISFEPKENTTLKLNTASPEAWWLSLARA